MLLSSLRRLRLFCSGQAETLLTDSQGNNRILMLWLQAVSYQIEKVLQRGILIESKTEYFDTPFGKNEFWLKNFPNITLTDVYEDANGLWDGTSEYEIEDCSIINDVGRLIVPIALPISRNSLRVRYSAGMAYDPVVSVIALQDGSSTSWRASRWIIGQTSQAVGIIKTYSSGTLTVEQYYGEFIVGETILQYIDEGVNPSSPSVAGVIESFTRESLLNTYPEIVTACEMQIRFMRQHQMDFENSGSTKDGITLRAPNPAMLKYPLREEVLNMLVPYIRTWGR